MNRIEHTLSHMVEVKLIGNPEDTFLKVVETLTRIGVANTFTMKLYQSCHILHKQGRYYIAHFKEMYKLDGRKADISVSDLGRRNYVAKVLQEWGLIEILSNTQASWPMSGPKCVKIIKHSEKENWELNQKYAIGVKKYQKNTQAA